MTVHGSLKGKSRKQRTYRQRARKEYLSISRNRKPRKKLIRKGIRQQLQYVRRDLGHIETLAEKVGLGVLSRRMYRNLLVVGEVYRQQHEMYCERKHKVDQRNVSISQPHIRPIIRGKVSAAVEFGAKVSFQNGGYVFLRRWGGICTMKEPSSGKHQEYERSLALPQPLSMPTRPIWTRITLGIARVSVSDLLGLRWAGLPRTRNCTG